MPPNCWRCRKGLLESTDKTLPGIFIKLYSPLLFPLDITWNLSVLLSVFDDMKIVCGGLRSYSHARKVSLKQISRNHLIEKVKKTDPKVTGLFDERTKVGISS